MEYTGGYLVIDEPLFRHGVNKHTSCDLTSLGQYAIKAVNAIQDTPWKVNQFTLDVVNTFDNQGKDIFTERHGKRNYVIRVNQPDDPDHPFTRHPSCERRDDWLELTPEARKDINKEQAAVRLGFEEANGEYQNFYKTAQIANTMGSVPFYFPHNMDFRTRIYPIPSYLQPQGCDIAKGLLRFHRPTPLGKDGFFWLTSILAAHWGKDKLSHEARNTFVGNQDDFTFEDLCRWVDDPVRHQGWIEADKPWQFLAIAFEYVSAIRSKDIQGFLSHLPGNLDGSCNGAQHLSILSRDRVGAIATNCTRDHIRHDLYMTVAERMMVKLLLEITNGNEIAKEWKPRVESEARDIVKRSVMTTPYGVTPRGVADFMKTDGHVKGMTNEWEAACFMRDLVWEAITATIPEGRKMQKYFSDVAKHCAENGKPLQWDTPAGVKVTQAYYNTIGGRVKAYDTAYTLVAQPEEGEDYSEFYERIGLDAGKMASAASPNVVHSCDASHLQITTVRCKQVGIHDFSMIHDSFGCPFSQMGLMRDILRQSAVDMYQGDYLLKWRESVEGYSGLSLSGIKVPKYGDFDINEILDAEYFFS